MMVSLHPFRTNVRGLPDLLPYAVMPMPDVVLNKDGSFLAAWKFDQAADGDTVDLSANIGNILYGLGNGWMLHVDAIREPEHSGSGYNISTYLAVTYKPNYGKNDKQVTRSNELLDNFQSACAALEGALSPFLRLSRLGEFVNDATHSKCSYLLSYLRQIITGIHHPICIPDVASYLDVLLGNLDIRRDLKDGKLLKLDDNWLGIVSIDGYGASQKNFSRIMLALLTSLSVSFRLSTRFIILSQTDAEKESNSYQKGWHHKIFSQFEQTFLGSANEAQTDLSGTVAGFLSTCLVLLNEDLKSLSAHCQLMRKEVQCLGLVGRIEGLNSLETWLGSLPGNSYANVRRPLVRGLNLADLILREAVCA